MNLVASVYNEYADILLDPSRLDDPSCPFKPCSVADINGDPVSFTLSFLSSPTSGFYIHLFSHQEFSVKD